MNQCTIVFGGFWGSEGKGDVVAKIVRDSPEGILAIRVGGPNAGHTIEDAIGVERKVQALPCAGFIDNNAICILGASAVIDPHTLAREIGWLRDVWESRGMPMPGIIIDRCATVITDQDREHEQNLDLRGKIGSTAEGVGAATACKVMRTAVTFEKWLADSIFNPDASAKADHSAIKVIFQHVIFADTVRDLNRILQMTGEEHVLIEGTQGVLLSLNTGGYYPYCTSRDATPEAIMGQIGLSFDAFDLVRKICVMRTFPIRVAGNSGPMGVEVTWADMALMTNGYIKEPEKTTVTKKDRRIALWDDQVAMDSIALSRPTELAITFVDYINPIANTCNSADDLPDSVRDWVIDLEDRMGVRISIIGVGPHKMLDFHGPLSDNRVTFFQAPSDRFGRAGR